MKTALFSERKLSSFGLSRGVLDTVNQLLFDAGQVGGNLPFSDFSKIWQDSAGTTPYTAVEQYVGKIIDKSPNALAFTQATSAARPVVSARVNYAPNSDDLTSALWTSKGRSSVSNISSSNPRGLALVSKIIPDTQANPHFVEAPGSITGKRTIRCVVKAAGWDCVALLSYGSAVGAQFNLTTGVASSYVGTTTNRSITPLGDGWFSISCDVDAVLGGTSIRVGLSNSFSAVGNGSDGVLVCGVETVVSRASRFQYVNTATDYDTVGFPNYAKFDSIDDNIVSTAGGGGTAGIYFCGAIQFNKVGAVQTIFSDTGTNSGYKLQLTAANQLQISAGNGTAFTTVNTTATFAAGDVSLVELWDDGTNLGVRLGEGTPVTVARPVVTAGTAQITIGKDNNAASSYAGINMFEPVWRYGAMPNATQREAIRATCRSKAGIV